MNKMSFLSSEAREVIFYALAGGMTGAIVFFLVTHFSH